MDLFLLVGGANVADDFHVAHEFLQTGFVGLARFRGDVQSESHILGTGLRIELFADVPKLLIGLIEQVDEVYFTVLKLLPGGLVTCVDGGRN